MVDVLNYSKELAKSELENLGFEVEFKEKYDDLVAPGAIIGQDPAAGTKLEKGSKVVLTVSKGKKGIDESKTITVPNITGKSFSAAQKEASDQDLYIKIVDTVFSSQYSKDQIISQDPASGSQVHAGSTINVVISLGIETVYTPDVQYREEQEAVNMLGAKNLNADVCYEESRDVAAGCVIRQDPEAGTSVNAGSIVTIYVSTGYTTSVPNVNGMEESEACSAITSAGLVPDVCYESSSTVGKGYVIRQDPGAGTSISQNDYVTIFVSTGEEYVEPAAPTLNRIKVASKPNKTTYYVGDSFDSSGLRVEAQYSDGTKNDVTNSCDIDTSSFDSDYSGSCTVNVSYYEDGEKYTASFIVTIKEPSIRLSQNSLTVSDNGSGRISATTVPSGQSVSWSSDDESIATVSNGTIYGVSAGTTGINAELEYNGRTYYAYCTVNVTRTELPKYTLTVNHGSGISQVGGPISSAAGEQVTVYATASNYYSFSRWESDNPSVPGSSNSSYTFTMPASDVTLTAYGKENELSDWTEESRVPAGARKEEVKYIYTKRSTRTGSSSSMSGWNLDNTVSPNPKKTYGNWSDWGVDKITETDTREVDKKTVYRYYYKKCQACGNRQPYYDTACYSCGKKVTNAHSYVKWSDKPYNQSKAKKVSQNPDKMVTTALDGNKWFFSTGNLNDTKIGTTDTAGPGAVVISMGYRSRSVEKTYHFYKEETLESSNYPSGSGISNVKTYVRYRER